jgi:hypothetical protein
MVKMLVLAVATLAVMGSSAMACSGHKNNKGGAVTASVPAPVIVIVAKA